MQAMFGRNWGSGDAKTYCFEGTNALQEALQARRNRPDTNSIHGGTVVYREDDRVWKRPNGSIVAADEVRNQESLSKIWAQESKKSVAG